MRYFQFSYEAQSHGGNINSGAITITSEKFPSQRDLSTLLCDGRVPILAGQFGNATFSFSSIFEFKNKADFDNWCIV